MHAFRTMSAYIFGAGVAFLFSLLTFLFQEIIDGTTFVFSLVILFLSVSLLILDVTKTYYRDLDKISKLIEDVNKGKMLPPLRELRRQ